MAEIYTEEFEFTLINNKTGAEKVLESAPDGWTSITHNHYRSDKYHTVLREEEVQLNFVLTGGSADTGGYYFLFDAYAADKTYADVTFIRKRLNRFTNEYTTTFEGEVNFAADGGVQFLEEWAVFSIKDSGKLAKFIARDEISVNVFGGTSLDDVAVTPLTNIYNDILCPPIDLYLYAYTTGNFGYSETFLIGETKKNYWNSAAASVQLLGDRYLAGDASTNESYKNDKDYAINVETSINGTYSIRGTFTDRGTLTFTLIVIYRNSAGGQIGSLQVFEDRINRSSTSTPSSYLITGSYDVVSTEDIESGATIEIVLTSQISTTGTVFVSANVASNIDFTEKYDGESTSRVNGLFTHDVGSKLIQLYTSELDTSKLLYAPILGRIENEWQTYSENGYFGNEIITRGLLLRGFSSSALNTSFSDFFQSLSSIKMIGLWFNKTEDYFEIKEVSEFYKTELFPADLGEVTDFSLTPASDYYYSNYQIGYPSSDNEELQGLNVVNGENEFNSPAETTNELNIRSVYKASSIDIELLRKKSKLSSASTDTNNDDSVYIISTDGEEALQGQLTHVSGFRGVEEYYNLLKTPRQNLKRSLVLFGTSLYGLVTKYLTFGLSGGETEITYTDPDSGEMVGEFDDITDSEFPEPVVWPEIMEFAGIYTEAIEEGLKLDPHRTFKLYALDQNWYGQVLKVSGNPYSREGTYTLIRVNEDRL